MQRLQLKTVDAGYFAGNAIMVHGVDAVGGDVHLVKRPVAFAEAVDALDGDAAQGQVLGEFVVVDREFGEQAAEPCGKNFHANCSRNRISPE